MSSTVSRPKAMMRSARLTTGSSRAPLVKTPRARGCGSGTAPLALYVVSTGAGRASTRARSHLLSSPRHWRPARTTGRLARLIMSAARSRSTTLGGEGAPVEERVRQSIGARGHPRAQGREDRAWGARELPRDGGHDARRRFLVAQDEGQALRAGGFEQLEVGAAARHPEETLHPGPAQA